MTDLKAVVSTGYQLAVSWLQFGYKKVVEYKNKVQNEEYVHEKRIKSAFYNALAKSDTRVGIISGYCQSP